MQAIVETLFDAVYLISVITIGILMIRGSKGNAQFKLFGLMAVYVVLGLVGLPVFTMGGGIGYVMQPSFGFLLGLIPTAWVIGRLTEKENGRWRIALACLAGLAVLYLIGLPYMYLIMKLYLHKSITVWTAIKAGMLVYLPGDAVKIALTVLLYKPLRRAIRK